MEIERQPNLPHTEKNFLSNRQAARISLVLLVCLPRHKHRRLALCFIDKFVVNSYFPPFSFIANRLIKFFYFESNSKVGQAADIFNFFSIGSFLSTLGGLQRAYRRTPPVPKNFSQRLAEKGT